MVRDVRSNGKSSVNGNGDARPPARPSVLIGEYRTLRAEGKRLWERQEAVSRRINAIEASLRPLVPDSGELLIVMPESNDVPLGRVPVLRLWLDDDGLLNVDDGQAVAWWALGGFGTLAGEPVRPAVAEAVTDDDDAAIAFTNAVEDFAAELPTAG